MKKIITDLSPADLAELRMAKEILENPGVAARLTNYLGAPVEKGVALLPASWQDSIGRATHDALMLGLKGALLTMAPGTRDARPHWHKLAAALSGGVGGAFGLPALVLELPVSTTIMLRSIADIGRAHGEQMATVPARLACLEVFALGGTAAGDDASESGYFAVRTALARAVSEAARYLTERTVIEEGAPALVRLVALVATRFQVQVSEKAAAMAVPLLGAIGGGGINLLFIEHFQQMSRGHFTVRKLERIHGAERVRDAYDAI